MFQRLPGACGDVISNLCSQVSVSLSANESMPGDPLSVKVKGERGSCVCVATVDKSLYLLKPGFQLSSDKVSISLWNGCGLWVFLQVMLCLVWCVCRASYTTLKVKIFFSFYYFNITYFLLH